MTNRLNTATSAPRREQRSLSRRATLNVARLRPSWAARQVLESAIITGRCEHDDPVALRHAARVTSRRSLRALAHGLRKSLAEPCPVNGIYPVRLTGAAADDPGAREACLALADTLDRAVAPDADVVIRIVRLLRDPDSALAGDCAARLVQDATALRFRLLLDE